MVRRTYEKQLASRAAHTTTPPYKVNPKMKNIFRKIKQEKPQVFARKSVPPLMGR